MREGHCVANPLDGIEPCRGKRRLPRPIRGDAERATVDAAIARAPQSHRLILTLLRETEMRAGEVLALRLRDVCLDAGREGLRVREAKNHTERMVVLGPTATPKSLRALRAHVRVMKGQPDHAPLFPSTAARR